MRETLKRWRVSWRQSRCRHECRIAKIEKTADGVRCMCSKCDKVIEARYGLALPGLKP